MHWKCDVCLMIKEAVLGDVNNHCWIYASERIQLNEELPHFSSNLVMSANRWLINFKRLTSLRCEIILLLQTWEANSSSQDKRRKVRNGVTTFGSWVIERYWSTQLHKWKIQFKTDKKETFADIGKIYWIKRIHIHYHQAADLANHLGHRVQWRKYH